MPLLLPLFRLPRSPVAHSQSSVLPKLVLKLLRVLVPLSSKSRFLLKQTAKQLQLPSKVEPNSSRVPPAAVNPVTALVSGHAQVISHPPQAATVPSDIESLKTRLDQAESDKNALEKQLDEKDGALKSAQKTQIDMAKMLGERKGEIDNAKWQIEDLEMAKADLEKELAKKKLATTPDEGLAVQAASDKKALDDMMRRKKSLLGEQKRKLQMPKIIPKRPKHELLQPKNSLL